MELGLQSSNDETAARIHRGYKYEVFREIFLRLRENNIRVCVHIIDGLPGETEAEMIKTAEDLAQLRPDGVKFIFYTSFAARSLRLIRKRRIHADDV